MSAVSKPFLSKLQGLRVFDILLSSPVVHVAIVLTVLTCTFLSCLNAVQEKTGVIGFALDDAWIHATVARNLIEGHGYGIVPGRTLSVSTSPTWTLLIALFLWTTGNPVVSLLSLSFFSMVVTCVLLYFLVVRITESPMLGLIAPIVAMLHPAILWGMMSGMEVPLVLAALMILLSLYYFYDADSRVRRYAVPVALAFAAMTRPEFFVAIPIAMLDTFRLIWKKADRRSQRLAIRTFFIQAVIATAIVAPYFIFNKWSSGLWFPTTYYAKTRVRGFGLSAYIRAGNLDYAFFQSLGDCIAQILEISNMLLNSNLPMLLLLVAGSLSFSKALGNKMTSRGCLLIVLMFFLPFITGAMTPARHLSNHADRYYAMYPVLGVILACLGLKLIEMVGRQPAVAFFCALLMLLAPWRTTPGALRLLIADVDSTERLYHAAGLWIKENIDPKAVLAVNDIGGVGYFANRDLIDVMGLASPEIWPAIQRDPGKRLDYSKFRAFLETNKVDYLLLSPYYYPQLTNDWKTFVPVMKWEERFDHDRKISPQILYRCDWNARKENPT